MEFKFTTHLVENMRALANAHLRISAHGDTIFLDAEGIKLGQTGDIRVLQIGIYDRIEHLAVRKISHCSIYVINLNAVPIGFVMQLLKPNLESADRVILFDCRSDVYALQKHHIDFSSKCFDLQVYFARQTKATSNTPGQDAMHRALLGPEEAKKLEHSAPHKDDTQAWAAMHLTQAMQEYASADIEGMMRCMVLIFNDYTSIDVLESALYWSVWRARRALRNTTRTKDLADITSPVTKTMIKELAESMKRA